jgi:1,4-alpha-glucan branching enzyme
MTRHPMPFGAQPTPDGTRFRLWAPDAHRLDLCLGEKRLPMASAGEGWWERTEPGAGPGTRYGYSMGEGPVFPDPASRFNPDDVHGPSEVIDPGAYPWTDQGWRGRPWHEAVVYELHVGTFTRSGSFAAAAEKLGYLAELGVTAVELMPVADFPAGATGATTACCPSPPMPPTAAPTS